MISMCLTSTTVSCERGKKSNRSAGERGRDGGKKHCLMVAECLAYVIVCACVRVCVPFMCDKDRLSPSMKSAMKISNFDQSTNFRQKFAEGKMVKMWRFSHFH